MTGTSHANRGKSLEDAIARAAIHYRREGRADVRKADAKAIWRDGRQIWIRRGDADFVGDADGKAIRLEAKETHADAFPLKDLKDHQRETLEAAAKRGCAAYLVIAFLPEWSVWAIPFGELAGFLAAPWRQSITRNMCCAWGLSLPVRATAAGKLMVCFLDGTVHPERAVALERVNADRMANPLELPLEEQAPRKASVLDRPLDPFDPVNLRKFARKKGLKTGMWGK